MALAALLGVSSAVVDNVPLVQAIDPQSGVRLGRSCPLLVGIRHFWREHPPNHGTGLLILGQH